MLEFLNCYQFNIITNAISKILNPPLDYAYKTGWIKIAETISPIQTVGMGGILIWGDNITEDANIVVPPAGITPIGHAGDEYTGTNPARGSYNAAESGAIEGGYRHVWDFATDRANGTIKCLSLTSKQGGNSGLMVGSDSISAFAALENVTEMSQFVSDRKILGEISHDRWAVLNLSNGNLEYYSNFNSSKIGISTTYDSTTRQVGVISPGFTDFASMNNYGIDSVTDDAILWLALKKNGRNVWLASVNLLTGEKLSEATIQLAAANGYNGDIVCSNSAYGGSRFYLKTYSKGAGYNSGALTFQGFILPPVEFEESSADELAREIVQRLTETDCDWEDVKGRVTELLDSAPEIKVGDTVTVNQGAKTYDGGKLAAFVYSTKYTVTELVRDRAVISQGKDIVAAVNVKDLTLA